MTTRVWVYDTLSRGTDESAALGALAVNGLAWSPAGDLAVGLGGLGRAADRGFVELAAGAVLTGLTKVGDGGLPVWVP